MAFIKFVGLLLSLLLVFHAIRDSSAHVVLGRKLKGDMVMATKEKYTLKMGTTAQDASAAVVVGKGDEERKMVNKEDKNKVESSNKKSDKYASEESLGGHQHHVNNQDQLSKEDLEAAEREVMNLMRRDYRTKPRQKPPINNNKPNN